MGSSSPDEMLWNLGRGNRRVATVLQLLGFVVVLGVALGGALIFLVAVGFVGAGDILADRSASQCAFAFVQPPIAANPTLAATVAILASIGALLLLVNSVSPRRRAVSEYILAADEQGIVLVDAAGIRTVAEAAALRTAGVLEATVRVGGRPTGPIRLRLQAWVIPGTDLKQAGTQAKAAVKAAVEQMVGLDVRGVAAKVHVLTDEELGRRVA